MKTIREFIMELLPKDKSRALSVAAITKLLEGRGIGTDMISVVSKRLYAQKKWGDVDYIIQGSHKLWYRT